ncbi:MAG: hypothetical protein ACPGRZ_04690 [Alphaproteobacteria bacterium]
MSRLIDKVLIVAASAVLAFSAVGPANATTWVITNVLTVSNDGGFGASSFHDATGNLMSGTNFGNITGGFGTYNDVTGSLSLTADVNQSGNVFSMSASSAGGFLFTDTGNATDFLANHNTLDVTFSDTFVMPGPDIAANAVTTIGFMLGDVCCSGPDNPNSFSQPGSDADERWMTLWGANGFNTSTGAYSGATLGMDLRIRLERTVTTTEVPAPAAHVIFGLGLLGLAYTRRRKAV